MSTFIRVVLDSSAGTYSKTIEVRHSTFTDFLSALNNPNTVDPDVIYIKSLGRVIFVAPLV